MNTHHRKLFSETDPLKNPTLFCVSFCDPTQNPSGCCPQGCINSCPSSCFNTPPPRGTISTVQHHHRSHKLQQSIIISISLVGLSCLIYCIFSLYKLYRNRRRRVRDPQQTRDRDVGFLDEEHGPVLDHPLWYIRTIGLEPSTIDLITSVKYKSGEGLVEGTECSVCLSEFEDDETLRLLPKCNHAFHLPCIDTWLRSHTNCPLCRAPIVSNPNGTLSPILEQSFEGNSVVEDSQVAVSEGSEVRERENGDSEMKGVESSQRRRGDSENAEIDEVQPMRRSVSMDSLASLRLRSDLANAQFGEPSEINVGIVPKRMDLNQGLKRFVCGSSFRRSLQKGPVLMKRSFSWSGKVLFPRHNQNINSVLPL